MCRDGLPRRSPMRMAWRRQESARRVVRLARAAPPPTVSHAAEIGRLRAAVPDRGRSSATPTTPRPATINTVFIVIPNYRGGTDVDGSRKGERLGLTVRSPAGLQGESARVGGVKITRILAYRVELRSTRRPYKWSGGKSVTVFDRTVVRVETDAGVIGHGKVSLGRSTCRPTRRRARRAPRAGAAPARRRSPPARQAESPMMPR